MATRASDTRAPNLPACDFRYLVTPRTGLDGTGLPLPLPLSLLELLASLLTPQCIHIPSPLLPPSALWRHNSLYLALQLVVVLYETIQYNTRQHTTIHTVPYIRPYACATAAAVAASPRRLPVVDRRRTTGAAGLRALEGLRDCCPGTRERANHLPALTTYLEKRGDKRRDCDRRPTSDERRATGARRLGTGAIEGQDNQADQTNAE